jgi:hypothetical protein
MQCIVTYVTDMYSRLPKIISEIQIFNSGYPSFGHCIYTWAGMGGFVIIFQSQKKASGKSAVDIYMGLYRKAFNTFNFMQLCFL